MYSVVLSLLAGSYRLKANPYAGLGEAPRHRLNGASNRQKGDESLLAPTFQAQAPIGIGWEDGSLLP